MRQFEMRVAQSIAALLHHGILRQQHVLRCAASQHLSVYINVQGKSAMDLTAMAAIAV